MPDRPSAEMALNPLGRNASGGPEGQAFLERKRPRGAAKRRGKKPAREGFGDGFGQL